MSKYKSSDGTISALALITESAIAKFPEKELAVLAGIAVGLGLAIVDRDLAMRLEAAAEEILNGDGNLDPNTPESFMELAATLSALFAMQDAIAQAEAVAAA